MWRTAAAVLFASGAASAECSPDAVEFRWPGGQARFAVEIVDTVEERARGLMFREYLARFSGMLFVYHYPQPVSFWMKNTLIPLDLIFVKADGLVGQVHPDAVPGDLTPISGPIDTLMVLEINGGLADVLGLGADAEMRHPALDQSIALWPCSEP